MVGCLHIATIEDWKMTKLFVWGSIKKKSKHIISFGDRGSGLSWDGGSKTPPKFFGISEEVCLKTSFCLNVRHPGWPRYPYCFAMFGYDMISRLVESTPMQQLHSNFGKDEPQRWMSGDQDVAQISFPWGGGGVWKASILRDVLNTLLSSFQHVHINFLLCSHHVPNEFHHILLCSPICSQ
jgi:hypothetical protein